MLTRAFPFLDLSRTTPAITARLRSLADASARFERDVTFVSHLLESAPLLDRYVPTIGPLGLQLIGEVAGHPILGSRIIRTSQIWFADPHTQWVRSLSRFYRLGRPGGPGWWPTMNGLDGCPAARRSTRPAF
jgi:hypothetical protein